MIVAEYLEEYRALTLDLMDEIVRGGMIENIVKERQIILNEIQNNEFSKVEIIEISNRLNLPELEENLNKMIKKEIVEVKKKIKTLKLARQANENYRSIRGMYSSFNKCM